MSGRRWRTGGLGWWRGGIDWTRSGWWAGRVTGSAGFAGRERELSSLRGALGGDARLLLVTGDAGVGKTRFVGEGMRRAAAGGMVSVLGGCLPLAGKLPLLPVADALGQLGRLDGGRLLEAALGTVPQYVRAEVGRLLPQLAASEPGLDSRGEGWQRERLFSAIAELLGAVAGRCGLGVVIEDVHWADGATLDCLTYLSRPGRRDPLTVVVTCRSDEAPLDAQVAGWLAHVRGGGGVEEIGLGPLSRGEVAEQIAGLAGGRAPGELVDDLYARAEGNPFFTEQLTAAALSRSAGGRLGPPSGLPARLAELLAARAGGCGADAGAVLAGLAVAGRPLTEVLLCDVTGLGVDAVRGGLRELAAARLLAASTAEGEHRPRHALLGEAVAAGLLPGERVVLHERTARALEAAGGGMLAAEVAGHWAAAGRATEELPARLAAAGAAEQVFGYAEAAAHWQRAIELCQAVPAVPVGIDVPRLYVRAIDALVVSGDRERGSALAEEAYRRFADHPDHATAAVICQRAAYLRRIDAPAAGLPLIKEALRLFGQGPPSADHAEAWFVYGLAFLIGEGRLAASLAALNRALQIAEAAGAAAVIPRCLAVLADLAFMSGQVEEGFALLDRGRVLARASGVDAALLSLAVNESDTLLKLGKFQNAAEVALHSLQAARQTGLEDSFDALQLADNASQALLARGRTAEAAALIGPLTTGPPDRGHRVVHERRAEIDMLRGDIDAALGRQQQIDALLGHPGIIDLAREAGQRAAELALWAGARRRPPGDQAGARTVRGPGCDDLLRAAAGGGHAGLRRSGRAGPGTPRRPRRRCRARGRRRPGLVGRGDGGYPIRRPSARGHDPRRPRHLGRRAHPASRGKRPRGVEHGRENLGRPGLPPPGRVRMVAARRSTAHRRPAPPGRDRPAGRRGRRRRPRATARPGPRARAAGPHPPRGTARRLPPGTAPVRPAHAVRADRP